MDERLGYVEEVRFIGVDGSKSVKVKCDTGAARTSICESLGEEIGLGTSFDTVTVHSSNGSQERDLYWIHVEIGGEKRSVEISVTDREGMNYDAILGRDVLESYLVDSGACFLLGEEGEG